MSAFGPGCVKHATKAQSRSTGPPSWSLFWETKADMRCHPHHAQPCSVKCHFAVRYPKFCSRDRLYPTEGHPVQLVAASHNSCSRHAKSLWSRCVPELGEILPTFQRAFCRFESWHPSQPLSSLWTVSAFRIISRHFRRLARDQSVSAAGKSVFSGRFRNSCARVSGREFLISRFCCLRLGSIALRPVRLARSASMIVQPPYSERRPLVPCPTISRSHRCAGRLSSQRHSILMNQAEEPA